MDCPFCDSIEMRKLTEIQKMLSDMESDRIERTISTNNIDKFSEAICAFANDFPNHNLPGYLIIGVDDKTGKPSGLKITDNILKDLAGIRNNGQILPQPLLTVEKYTLDDGEIALVEVFPSLFPPVRYKGITWIRTGPTKSRANETEENRLIEKRAGHAKTFDMSPALGSTLNDLNIDLFKLNYLPNAIDKETLALNHRDLKSQMASLRLFDLKHNCSSNAGVLLFGVNPKFFLPGAYIQYANFAGDSVTSDIINEKEFSGDLITVLAQLDLFIKNQIETRSVFTSALREELVKEYPSKALRELLNNAVMHRNYESNAPIKFYQFKDRIEISNSGGLYGDARPDNFPFQNDYRNPVIAEALKILGYVNRFNRGIASAKEELQNNGNPEPIFEFKYPLHFAVTIAKKTV
jgi:ATP-dependent DNA helicase RecG